MASGPAEVMEEYRIAYRQLQAVDRQQREIEERMSRDYDLALARYQRARSAYSALALGEDDEFAIPEGPEE